MQLHHSLSVASEQAPWLVLIHGLFGSADNLAVVKRHFEPNWNIVSVDLPDHGKSPWTDEFTIEQASNALAALLDTIGLTKPAVLGHSLGGKVAMHYAITNPNAISHLIVADIAPTSYTHRHQAVFDGLLSVDLQQISGRKDAELMMRAHVKEPGVRQFLLKSLHQDENNAWRWRFNVSGLINSYANIIDWEHSLGQFNGETLFIKGGLSDYITSEYREAIVRHFPRAKAHIIEGTGHWLHAEKPNAFNSIVERHLKPLLK